MKYCPDCDKELPLTSFYVSKRTGRPRTHCKYHTLARNSAWQKDHRPQLNTWKTQYRKINGRPLQRKHDLWGRFNLTIEQYNELLKQQSGVCAICGKPETAIHGRTKTVRHLAVDHCHNTNVIRGLLCNRCNIGIGRFHDSPELLIKAANYVRR